MTATQYKIAIIEDDVPIRQMYKFRLENDGYQIKTAGDGLEGLKLIEEYCPHLVLLDLRMPVMSGDEMLQRLREKEWGADIRVIILTNISKNEAPHALRFLNVDRYIVKAHYTPHQVTEIVKEVLEG
jgi:DNA-binding response OmpR family regulator